MRYIVGFLITIGLIILILVLLLRGGGSSATAPKALNLGDYAYGSATAQLIIDGPIVADPNHREIEINVSQDAVSMNVYQGYQQTTINSKTYLNNESAYAVFLHALQNAGFTKGNTSAALSDERGYCPGGDRYIYSFNNDGTDLMRFWSTSCGGQGTFKGTPSTILYLFQNQVPDYSTLTQNVVL